LYIENVTTHGIKLESYDIHETSMKIDQAIQGGQAPMLYYTTVRRVCGQTWCSKSMYMRNAITSFR
jgi:hypothetical protein